MSCKYKGISLISTAGLLCLTAALTACEDDLGKSSMQSGRVIVKVEMPGAWTAGTAANENAPDSRCTAVGATESTGDTPLYLHTIESDNPAEPALPSRGAIVNSVSKFSLSGVCYSGTYEDEEATATPNFVYDVTCTVNGDGSTVMCPQELLWPVNGKVRFFAYSRNDDTDPYVLSRESEKGSPKISYTVPSDVKTQHDLLAACTDATSADITLHFHHILTAVKIVTATDMIPGTITSVKLSGVHNEGTYTPNADGSDGTWKPGKWATGSSTGTYTVSREVNVDNDYTQTDNGELGGKEGASHEVVGETDDLTLMMIPQTLPEGAKLEIEFTEKISGKSYTLSADLTGSWPEGKIVTYSISPSSIHIKPVVNFNKNDIYAEKPDSISYAGVWYDAKYSAQAEITQGTETKTVNLDKAKVVSLCYNFTPEKEDGWADCTPKSDGVLKIASQPAYETMRTGFNTETEVGSESSPESLTVGGKTANCYLVDKAGFFSLPLVYGNGNVVDPKENTKSLKYYPKHDDGRMPADGKITGVKDAVLCWQDAPDLIDPVSVKVKDGNLVFHIRKHTLTQGNALLAVRNAAKDIIWSWHIWVTPHKTKFYSEFYTSNPDATYSYDLAKYNLGWCDIHAHNESRYFKLKAVIDLREYGGPEKTDVEIGTFKQDEFKGSDAGDNTYYQWGRKDPMLGGIYNAQTPCYTYYKPSKSEEDLYEFTMENKQVFNQYNQDGCNYSFCKNPGDMVEPSGEASKGVTIGYAIKHPYMFITNSKEYKKPSKEDQVGYDQVTGTGYDPHTGDGFNYRNHWHIPYVVNPVEYLHANTHIMFNAWNSAATDAGYDYDKTGELSNNAAIVTKSVYDPCPPEFQMPPIHALKGVYDRPTSEWSYNNNAWTITSDGKSITFPMTGVRNYALRPTEWESVKLAQSAVDYKEFYKISMPAFRMLTFVSSATIVEKEPYNAYQVYIFSIDRSTRGNAPGSSNLKKGRTPSSNSYGLSVRPMYYKDSDY